MAVESQNSGRILAINSGSSSLKFALFGHGETLDRLLTGKFERIGLPDGVLTTRDLATGEERKEHVTVANHAACVPPLWKLLNDRNSAPVGIISHRIVHGGMHYGEPQLVTARMIADLRAIISFAPQHLPAQTELLEAFARHYQGIPQVACFDTAFHRNMPRVAKLLPLPRRYDAQGVQRYGFHGLSYTYLMRELERVAGAEAARGRVIIAHLGNGASMAAVKGGGGIDTTMGFTPAAGLVMSTRTGDIDPGLVAYLAHSENMTADQFNEMANAKSGLLGVSETSSDTRDLLAQEGSDARAAEALELFCYSARKWIGALAAALEGLDTLVFSAGIGENSPELRERICAGLGFLGVDLEPAANRAKAPIISRAGSRVTVRIIPTDEELLLAQEAIQVTNTAGVQSATAQSNWKDETI